MGLVLQNFAFGTLFDGEDPSAANGLLIGRNILEGVCAKIKELLDFGIHGFFLFRPVRTRHDLFERFQVI